MSLDPSRLSLEEIRRRVLAGGEPVTSALLRRLRRDPRRGARNLHEALARRREEQKRREARLDTLLHFERLLWRSGVLRVAGVDEVGVGPMAGPVVAAAVVFRSDTRILDVDDSKRLLPEVRERLAQAIEREAEVGLGVADVSEIDRLNVYRAALVAMQRAVQALSEPPQHLLVDAREVPGMDMPQNMFHKGDGIDYSIAAASIVAKTRRDRMMLELDRQWPVYGFARHKGYCTSEHQRAVREHGPSPVHRMSYPFLRELCGGYSARFYELQRRLAATRDREALARFERQLETCDAELALEERRKLRLSVNRRWSGPRAGR